MDEISAVAYDKAVAVVSENAVNDALKASTEQVDIYLDWLKEPGRTASKETLDYTTYQITTLRKNIIAAVNRITARLTTVLIKPEIKKACHRANQRKYSSVCSTKAAAAAGRNQSA